MKVRKTWCEKLADSKDLPKVVKISKNARKKWGCGTIAIPAPLDVNAIMKKVPKGKVTTINEIRNKIAKKYNATVGCPITSGIFSWIAANAAEEKSKQGKKKTTPYWRTLKSGGVINEKYPGGIDRQKKLLQSEGHKIIKKGKRYVVEGYEAKLYK
jgi:alkylated DNA nucleotide flippase Atl1